jgi:hypothetical protein
MRFAVIALGICLLFPTLSKASDMGARPPEAAIASANKLATAAGVEIRRIGRFERGRA